METAWPLWEVHSPAQLSSWWKNFSLYLARTSPVSACAHCLLSSHLTPLWRAYLCLPDNLLIGTVGLQLGALKAVSSPGWTSHFPQPLLMGQVLQPQPPRCPSSELTSFSHGGSNANGDGWYSCPPDPSSSQTNVLVAAKVTSLTYFLHVTVPPHVGPKSFIQTSRALTPQGAQLNAVYPATSISHFCDPQATQAASWDARWPQDHLLPTP